MDKEELIKAITEEVGEGTFPFEHGFGISYGNHKISHIRDGKVYVRTIPSNKPMCVEIESMTYDYLGFIYLQIQAYLKFCIDFA